MTNTARATNAVVLSLREPGEIDPSVVLTGPLRRISRVHLEPGESARITADGAEFTLFVLDGSGTAANTSTTVPLSYGVSVTVPLHVDVLITASEPGLAYFLAELAVDPA